MLRSTESLTAIAIRVRVVALRQKYLQGNQNLRERIPLIRSKVIAIRQASDAVAMYIPIHGIGLLNFVSSKYPSLLHPLIPMLLFTASAYATINYFPGLEKNKYCLLITATFFSQVFWTTIETDFYFYMEYSSEVC